MVALAARPKRSRRVPMHAYEVRPRRDKRGVAAIYDALPLIIALTVGGVLVFTAVAAAVIVNLFRRRPN
jgi:hypothetical protein